ncbi:uncharacterized protein TrAFT101_003498 [Trichoderma asperellum]|uniref:uncharacterized protein n=1 Tax=Trichoderma asperellum TaxID=101201 RepID=UPI003323D00C|nr:hypothetical protein TrAFT101_003498 [Trichoderma asperellum]
MLASRAVRLGHARSRCYSLKVWNSSCGSIWDTDQILSHALKTSTCFHLEVLLFILSFIIHPPFANQFSQQWLIKLHSLYPLISRTPRSPWALSRIQVEETKHAVDGKLLSYKYIAPLFTRLFS